MNLKNILIGIEGLKAKGSLDLDISSVECDYRTVKKDSLFVAIKGYKANGHDYINEAKVLDEKVIINNNGYQFELNGEKVLFDGYLKVFNKYDN